MKKMIENENYEYLIGKYITNYKETKQYIDFITNDNYVIRIDKFVPYCCCNVGEYIDEITKDGTCCGVITNIETDISGNQEEWYNPDREIVYAGNVSFYFENGKMDFRVHGEDNGYYGVSFTMPVEVFKEDKK